MEGEEMTIDSGAAQKSFAEYMKGKPVIFMNWEPGRPIGRVVSWRGEVNETTVEGGEGEMKEWKDMTLEDIQKERPDLLKAVIDPAVEKAVGEAKETIKAEIEAEMAEKVKDPEYVGSVAKSLGFDLKKIEETQTPAGEGEGQGGEGEGKPDPKDEQIKSLTDRLDKLEAKEKAEEEKKAAEVELEKVLSDERFKSESKAVMLVAKNAVLPRLSKPELVMEQIELAVESAKSMTPASAKSKGHLFEVPPPPVTEQGGEEEEADATGLTPSQKKGISAVIAGRDKK
jgi:hypothetical protein